MPSADASSAARQRMEALQQAEALLRQGDAAGCVALLQALAEQAQDDPRLLQEVALRFTVLDRHEQAERCSARARALCPDDPEHLYNHATTLIALGRLEEAEALLDRVIELAPGDGDAWYNRATLRRQTPQRNHVAALERRLAQLAPSDPAEIPFCYALAKEREDLGEHATSFAALARGADPRRRRLPYRVDDDLDTMRLIAETFDAGFFSIARAGHADPRPVFVVGLPRSGTTLVDRILGSHRAVTSRGESTDLAQAVVRLAGPAAGKAELVRRSALMDPRPLGEAYCRTLPAGPALRVVDKTPNNFLYLGLVATALPQARIVHLRRNPMDACYAMYKTLFRMAYPYSYDLRDLGRYWLGYDRLMAHWRDLLPADRFLEVDYESLVSHQEPESRRLVAHLGLDWDPACLAFEHNPQPTLTASAAQVRQPLYRTSVGAWRRHAEQLEPLRRMLAQAGAPVDRGMEETH